MANITGRKGGGSNASSPKESPDSLHSVATAKILLALSEGECAGGLTDQDIYLDGTPIRAQDGTLNFPGVTWEYRSGTQVQEYIQGIPSVENEITVNTPLKQTQPWTRAISNTQLSALRIRLGLPALQKQKDNGDVVGSRVEYKIELATDGGAYQTVVNGAFDGKTTSLYERSHRIDLPKATTGWQVRVTRLTADSVSNRVADATNIEAYSEVIDAKLRYPNTELLFVTFDAKQFSNIPQISVKAPGRLIRVPTTYDPVGRTYSGTWDGSFKWAYSNNPAWVFYDMVLNPRFGLGDRLDATQVDKWELYRIAQYCDQLVPDGLGGSGTEPRFLCDVFIQSQNEAFNVLRDLASIFRGMTYWANNQLFALADQPRDMTYIFIRTQVHADSQYRSQTLRYFVNNLQYRRERGTGGWGGWERDMSYDANNRVNLPANAGAFIKATQSVALIVAGGDHGGGYLPFIGGTGRNNSGYQGGVTYGEFVNQVVNTWPWPAFSVQMDDSASKAISWQFTHAPSGVGDTDASVTGAAITVSNAANGLGKSVVWAPTSDKRLKKDIEDWDGESGLANIEALELKTFRFTNDAKRRLRRGIIAQQAERVDDEYVRVLKTQNADGEDVETLTLDTTPLLLDALAAIQVLSRRVSALEKQLAEREPVTTSQSN